MNIANFFQTIWSNTLIVKIHSLSAWKVKSSLLINILYVYSIQRTWCFASSVVNVTLHPCYQWCPLYVTFYLMMQIPPPSTMLTAVKIPSIDSIQFHRIQSFTTYSEQQHPTFATSQVPVYMQVDHIRSNFVYVSLLGEIIYIN